MNENSAMVGRDVSDEAPPGVWDAAKPVILSARGLTKEFRGFFAVNNVDISVREGSIHALIGPNGAGKTTVFNLLTKFLMPTGGKIVHRDLEITKMAPADVVQRGLVRSFQISAVFGHLSVLQNVRVALQRPRGLATNFWSSNEALACLDVDALPLIESVGLGDFTHVMAGELAYGRKRALELATTLALKPDIMLLDEPMAGMGHEDVGQIARLIRKASAGRTILMVEHNLSVVEDLCDFVTVMERGQVIAEGSYAAVSSNPRVREAYIGTDDD
jgi:branched-chain amino acid transport system ATP-binding protein